MHRLLETDDILYEIAYELISYNKFTLGYRGQDLTNLSRVNKYISRIILDIIWQIVPIQALPYLFPRSILKRTDSGNLTFRLSPAGDDWSRFHIYVPRIKTLYKPYLIRPHEASTILTKLLHHCPSSAYLLPHTRCIQWSGLEQGELPLLSRLFSPSLTTLSVDSQDYSVLLDDPFSVTICLERLLQMNCDLKKISLFLPPYMIPFSSDPSCVSLLNSCSQLVDVCLAASPDIVRVLSRIPTLKYLSLTVRRSNESNDTPSTPDSSFRGVRFISLQKLTIFARSLPDINNLLTESGCHPRREIAAHLHDAPESEDFSTFLSVILHPTCHSELMDFALSWKVRPNGDNQKYQLTMNHFRLLLSYPNLSTLNIHPSPGDHICFTDDDLRTVAEAWPTISMLGLSSERTSDMLPIESTITLEGLAHLTRCTKLRYLAIKLIVNEPNMVLAQSISSNSPLMYLGVGTSFLPVEWIASVSKFIYQCFPSISYIQKSPGVSSSAWEAVQKELSIF